VKTNFKKNPPASFTDIKKLTPQDTREEAEALRDAIEYHNYLYYVKNQPVISDAAYDRLFRRLQELEDAFPDLRSDTSPTQRVGAPPLEKLKKMRHTAPMLSLHASIDEREVRRFDEFIHRMIDTQKVTYIVEPKFDGLSVEIVYRNGIFHYGATRGDGEVGEDISENLKTIGAVPLRLQKNSIPPFLAVHGEVFMFKKGFFEINKQRVERGEEPFANPRNAAAGIVRLLDPKKVTGKPLSVVFYEIIKIEGKEFTSHWEALEQFPEWGLRTEPHSEKCTSFGEIKKYHKKLSSMRDSLEYEIDGIVIKLDDYKLRAKLGTRQRSPRWAFAWKFPPKEEITTVEDVVIQVGRTGILTPVALLQPVDVGGVTISRATLHNEEEILKKDIRIGDKVRIVRAGDVIPEVLKRIEEPDKKRTGKFSMVKKCPTCGSEVYKEGAYYFCSAGLSCPGQLVGHIVHYASRRAVDIDGLGEKTVKQLVGKGMVHTIADLYRLSIKDFLKLEGFAEKSAAKLYQAIQSAKKIRLDRFLYALGIRHVGEHVAQILARKFRSLRALQNANHEDIEKIEGIGPEIARSASYFFKQKDTIRVLEQLAEIGVEVTDMPEYKKELPLEGKTFVFTGELEKYTRDEAEKKVEEFGDKATSSVSSKTDFLIAGRNPGSKFEDARKYGIRILNEKEFEELLKK
jgi:DNA ligase (NAD+)